MPELDIGLAEGGELNFDESCVQFNCMRKKCMRRVLLNLTLNE